MNHEEGLVIDPLTPTLPLWGRGLTGRMADQSGFNAGGVFACLSNLVIGSYKWHVRI
jgi:hypothetical protein